MSVSHSASKKHCRRADYPKNSENVTIIKEFNLINDYNLKDTYFYYQTPWLLVSTLKQCQLIINLNVCNDIIWSICNDYYFEELIDWDCNWEGYNDELQTFNLLDDYTISVPDYWGQEKFTAVLNTNISKAKPGIYLFLFKLMSQYRTPSPQTNPWFYVTIGDLTNSIPVTKTQRTMGFGTNGYQIACTTSPDFTDIFVSPSVDEGSDLLTKLDCDGFNVRYLCKQKCYFLIEINTINKRIVFYHNKIQNNVKRVQLPLSNYMLKLPKLYIQFLFENKTHAESLGYFTIEYIPHTD